MTIPGRNDICPCGSGKKFKHCCGFLGVRHAVDQPWIAQQDAIASKREPDVNQAATQHNVGTMNEAQQHYQLGNALAMQGHLDQAISHYQDAITLQPGFAEAHNNLGNAYRIQGKTEQAIVHYERALALKPDYAQAHYNLGNTFKAQRKLEQAGAHYQRAVAVQPNFAEAHNSLGNTLLGQRKIDQAIVHCERALALKPNYAPAHYNLGNAFMAQGQVDQALFHHERAVALWPDHVPAHSNLLYALHYASNRDPAALYAAHLDFARRWEVPLAASIQSPANDRSPERRLRVGYVSSDFREHSVSYFIEPVLAHHDRGDFEVFCYSNYPQEDKVTERLKSYADHWRCLAGLSDEQVTQLIRDDRIDILIDLNGHTGHNRLLVFARRAAPLQVTWLGYPNTTGLSAMDYRLTDGFADPPGMTERLHSEKLIRLPECFSCYQPPQDAPAVSGLPAREKGYVMFGSFNNLAKITPRVRSDWAKILQAVPGARLALKNPGLSSSVAQWTIQTAFAELGIASDRLELLGRDPSPRAHLERYRSIDIGLDPLPYNGATTTCEALWMGVPVITQAGRTHAGRVGASLLSNLGLLELISHTPDEYIETAVRLAVDWERLSALRAGLRARMAASPLTDGQRFTTHLEQAYRAMWQDWCHHGISRSP